MSSPKDFDILVGILILLQNVHGKVKQYFKRIVNHTCISECLKTLKIYSLIVLERLNSTIKFVGLFTQMLGKSFLKPAPHELP